jgi:hypothetical protein
MVGGQHGYVHTAQMTMVLWTVDKTAMLTGGRVDYTHAVDWTTGGRGVGEGQTGDTRGHAR